MRKAFMSTAAVRTTTPSTMIIEYTCTIVQILEEPQIPTQKFNKKGSLSKMKI